MTKEPALTTRDLTQVALCAALIAVCAWLSVPYTIPFTMQSFAVCLIGALLGRKKGTLSVLIYILLGAVGLPVFSGFRSGIGALLGATGGYIFGFLLTAWVIGLAVEKGEGKAAAVIGGMVLGMLLCYACGTAWFVGVYTRGGKAITVIGALQACVIPYLPFDAIKCALAWGLYTQLRRLKLFRAAA